MDNDNRKFDPVLLFFERRKGICRSFFERKNLAELLDEAVRRGYVYANGYSRGSDGRKGDTLYFITDEGIVVRNSY